MKASFGPVVISLLVLWAACAGAQNNPGNADTTATQVGPQPAFIYPDATPSLDFLSQSLENSSITLGVRTGIIYYANGYGSGGATLFDVYPFIRLQQFHPKIVWNIGYAAGYQTYLQSKDVPYNNNLLSQAAQAGLLWQLAPHWQLAANDSYIFTANPFQGNVTINGTPTLNNPNPVATIPLTQYKMNQAIVSLTHQLTKTDTLSFTGTQALRETSTYNVVSSVPFYNLVSYGGMASYQHKLSPRLSLGASYNYNSLDFGRGEQRSGLNIILLTADYSIRRNMTISGWLGPEYTTIKTVLGLPVSGQIVSVTSHQSLWSTSGGANYAWRSQRNVFRAGFARRVWDGGGITATSQVTTFSADYRRMLTAKLDGFVGSAYFHNTGLTNIPVTNTSLTTARRTYGTTNIRAGLEYKLTRSLTALGNYAFVHYNPSNAFLINSRTYNNNLLSVSVSYSWNHPLGR